MRTTAARSSKRRSHVSMSSSVVAESETERSQDRLRAGPDRAAFASKLTRSQCLNGPPTASIPLAPRRTERQARTTPEAARWPRQNDAPMSCQGSISATGRADQ
jgi:hypothetical protein